MSWFPAYWYGAGVGGTIEVIGSIVREGDLTMPIQTRVIEILQAEMSGYEVFADFAASEGSDNSIVVETIPGEWDISQTSFQRRAKSLRIWVFSKTSDGAERAIARIGYIIRRVRDDLRATSAQDLQGGFDPEDREYFRGLEVRFIGAM